MVSNFFININYMVSFVYDININLHWQANEAGRCGFLTLSKLINIIDIHNLQGE